MNTMLLTRISGAALLTALVAMIVSFAGEILVPPGGREAGHGQTAGAGHGGTGGAGEAAKPAKDPPVARLLASADLEAGKKLARRCVQCHTLETGGDNKLGPNLYGVLGRDRGAHPGFDYSAGMKAAGGKWTYENLYAFLRNPLAEVKGTKMIFKMPKPEDRANLLFFLRTLSDSPLPLPPVPKEEEKKPAAKAPTKTPEEKKEAAGKPEARKSEEKKSNQKPAEKPAEKPADKAPAQTASAVSAGALLAAADAKRGATLTRRKCAACHSFAKGASHKVGPNLYGVVLRERGAVEGYSFSSAMKAKDGKWTYADLLTYLENPKAFVKGTKMVLRVPKAEERADIIAYLRTLHETPPPLPAQ